MALEATYNFLTYSKKAWQDRPAGLGVESNIWSYLSQLLDLVDAQLPKVLPHEPRKIPTSDHKSSP